MKFQHEHQSVGAKGKYVLDYNGNGKGLTIYGRNGDLVSEYEDIGLLNVVKDVRDQYVVGVN